ncbi:hypothetical protein PENANT_c014G05166 [Penicillium antarcticum]|uniref:Uncharacterized protein n=1 Tax=Penicillium antarcticum TaxID=416450 RepID=A0A1V6Q590_9EURO|nr:hypothetical protein PENANT_c014G05166 [Penicillium antarcticum]
MPDSLKTSDFSAFDFDFSDSSVFTEDDIEKPLLEFEFHFDISARNLHSWDEKLITSPLKALRASVHRYLITSFDSSMNILLAHANVHEVSTVNGINRAWPVVRESEDIYDHLFFSKALF